MKIMSFKLMKSNRWKVRPLETTRLKKQRYTACQYKESYLKTQINYYVGKSWKGQERGRNR